MPEMGRALRDHSSSEACVPIAAHVLKGDTIDERARDTICAPNQYSYHRLDLSFNRISELGTSSLLSLHLLEELALNNNRLASVAGLEGARAIPRPGHTDTTHCTPRR